MSPRQCFDKLQEPSTLTKQKEKMREDVNSFTLEKSHQRRRVIREGVHSVSTESMEKIS